MRNLETHLLVTAAAAGAFMRSVYGAQPKRVVRAQYRKKRNKKNAMAKASRRLNRK